MLADFGLSTIFLGTRTNKTNRVGSYYYESPEHKNNQKVCFESDWYAAGMILFKLCGNSNIKRMGDFKRRISADITKLRY